jgi:hypothetical protein
MSIKNTIISIVVSLVVGIAIGYYSLPAKIITKTEIKTVTQVVTNTSVKKKDNTVTIITKKPDGTTITLIKDNNVENSISSTQEKTEKDESSSRETDYDKNYLSVGALAVYDFHSGNYSYGGYINRQFLGPITIGVQATTSPQVGIMLGVKF